MAIPLVGKAGLAGFRKAHPLKAKTLSASLVFSIYTIWSTQFYGNVEGWDVLDCIYFSVVTMSTVGYGDMSPTTPTSEYVTVAFIFFGIIVVFSEVQALVILLVTPIFKCVCNMVDRAWPQRTIDLDGDGGSDFKIPREPSTYYLQNLAAPIILIVFGQNAWAAAFNAAEGWGYRRSWYHCMTTFTTVGYGDVSIETPTGKIIAIFHIIYSVSLLGALISEIFRLMADRADQLKRYSLLTKRLDPELIKSLDTDGGSGVDKTEFVTGMLIKLELVDEADVLPYLKQFDELDIDGSGVLTSEDLDAAAAAMAEKKAATEAASAKPAKGKKGKKGATDNSSTTAPAPAAAPPPVTRLDAKVRRGEKGMGIRVSESNDIIAISGTAAEDGVLQIGDVIVGIDGMPLVDMNGGLVALKDRMPQMPKKDEYLFLLERTKRVRRPSADAKKAVTAPAPASAPVVAIPDVTPSLPAAPDFIKNASFAWGALNLPRDQLQSFLDLAFSGGAQTTVRPVDCVETPVRMQPTLEPPAPLSVSASGLEPGTPAAEPAAPPEVKQEV